jgi:hypothetical protein
MRDRPENGLASDRKAIAAEGLVPGILFRRQGRGGQPWPYIWAQRERPVRESIMITLRRNQARVVLRLSPDSV